MQHPLIVTAGIIRRNDTILITRRPDDSRQAGKWEFPGGKLEPGESPSTGLARELAEELDLPVRVDGIFDVIYHRYDWGTILLLVYECTPLADQIRNLQVAEHRFVPAASLLEFDLLEADRPLVQRLIAEAARPPI
jgi:8-oxo-dGTP diphosphatase